MVEMTAHEIDSMLEESRIGRLGMADESGHPYVIPMPFCWADGKLYLRIAMSGRKGEVLSANRRVCFEIDEYSDDFSRYASVLVEGELQPVATIAEKEKVKSLTEAKYLRLRNGNRPGHGRQIRIEDLPLQRLEVYQISGRKRA